MLIVRPVAVSLGTDTGVPRFVWVEGTEAAAAGGGRSTTALEGGLVGARGGAVVAVLELSELVVEPAYDAAGGGTGRAVGVGGVFPGEVG